MNSLGALYVGGLGVPQSYERAIELYQQSEAQGNALAYVNHGGLHEDGVGTPKNFLEARRLYKMSLEQGFASAAGYLNRVEEKIALGLGLGLGVGLGLELELGLDPWLGAPGIRASASNSVL